MRRKGINLSKIKTYRVSDEVRGHSQRNKTNRDERDKGENRNAGRKKKGQVLSGRKNVGKDQSSR